MKWLAWIFLTLILMGIANAATVYITDSDCSNLFDTLNSSCSDDIIYTEDMDCSGITWTRPACADSPYFTGSFSGTGYATISNLTINCPNDDWCGIFSQGGATKPDFDKVLIDNIYVHEYTFNFGQSTGALIGLNAGSITNSRVTNSHIEGDNQVGGLVGNGADEIINSGFTGWVDLTFGNFEAGGLCARCYNTLVNNSWVKGNVTGGSQLGGLIGIGNINTNIWNSYYIGRVDGSGGYNGGLFGMNANAYNSYASVGFVDGPEGGVAGVGGYNCYNIENTFSLLNVSDAGGPGFSGFGSMCGDGTFNVDNGWWNNITGNLDYCFNEGNDPTSGQCNVTQNDVSHYQSIANEPLASWDFNINWAIDPSINDGLPYLLSETPESLFDCVINLTNSTMSGWTEVLRLQNSTGGTTNAHAQLINDTGTNYTNTLYCKHDAYTTSNSGGTTFLGISNTTNAHAENPTYGGYSFGANINFDGDSIPEYISIRDTCQVDEICMLSIQNDTGGDGNAHVAECSYYTNKVCLSVGEDETNPSVTITNPLGNIVDVGTSVDMNATIIEDFIQDTKVIIIYPNSTEQQINLTNVSSTEYTTTFAPPISGQYNITFYADDIFFNVNNTETTTLIADYRPNITLPFVILTEGANVSLNLSTYTTDADNDSLTWVILNETTTQVDCNITGEILYIEAIGDFFGSSSCGISVSDGLLNASDTLFVNVTNINDAPVFNASFPISNISFAEDTYNDSVNLISSFYDVDGDSLTYTCIGNDSNIVFNTLGGVMNTSATLNWFGSATGYCYANDGLVNSGNSNTFSINVTPVNDAPVLSFVNQTISINTSETIQLVDYTTDVDNDVPLDMIWSLISENPAIADCSFVGNALKIDGVGLGNSTCVINVTDGSLSDQEPIYIEVVIPNLNITSVQSGIDWSRITWTGPSCPT
jgi:hypothetical protein